jgi:hypothetical protein
MQGPKDGVCPFVGHSFENEPEATTSTRAKIVKLPCSVKLHFFIPQFKNGKPSVNQMAIISYGKHTHPPPPPRKIPPAVRQKFIEIVQAFGVGEATARRLVASPVLAIMLNGKLDLSQEHITLANADVINYLIRKERIKEYPWGMDFQGAQFLMTSQQNASNPYIRETILYPDGHFVVFCQSKTQSRFLTHSTEIHADKTFSRTKCREFEFNSYDPVARKTTTLARVFTDYEDEEGYYRAFKLVFDQAEKDMKYEVHLNSFITNSRYHLVIKLRVMQNLLLAVE